MQTIHIIGDSTVEDQYIYQYGWGGQLAAYLPDAVRVENHAIGGRSSRSFWEEGRFAPVESALRPGDLLLIAFGHNDATIEKPERYADAETTFPQMLAKYLDAAEAAGATPVLVTCTARRTFDDKGTLTYPHGRYPAVTCEVAATRGVPLIDLTEMMRALLVKLGPEGSRPLYVSLKPGAYEDFPDGKEDATHLTLQGARTAAQMVAGALLEKKLIKEQA